MPGYEPSAGRLDHVTPAAAADENMSVARSNQGVARQHPIAQDDYHAAVFVLSDLDLGMNNWMADPFTYPDKPIRRGKVLDAEDLERLQKFERYRDVDGDGIPYRTLPGTDHPLAAYFTRGSGHNEKAVYSERPEDYKNNMDRLKRKYETARQRVLPPVLDEEPGTEVGIIAFGRPVEGPTRAMSKITTGISV